MGKLLIGSLTRAYTAAEYATKGEDCPAVGYVWDDEQNGKRYIFVENEGSSDLPENHCCKLHSGGEASYQVELSSGLSAPFAGIRPDGSDTLSQNEFGYVQIAGPAIGLFGLSATAITAELRVVTDDDSDGGMIGGWSDTHAAAMEFFGIAHESCSTTDAEVDITISRNVWGK